jgi:predicted RNA-binding protein with PIN domain
MADILIDGYNLIGIAHGNLEKARNNLIEDLRKYSMLKKHNTTIVFDGWKDGQKDQTRIKTGHVTVIYSRLGETADNVIKRFLSSSTKPWIVISSDREVSDFAAKKDFAAVTSDEFEEKLYSALHNHDNIIDEGGNVEEALINYYEDEIEYYPVRQKGNPRKLSRRQKKKLQALKKL